MKRLLSIFFIALMAMPSFAQKQQVYEGFDIYNLDGAKKKKGGLGLDFGLGTEGEFGLRYQRNFGKFFSWDIIGAKAAYDFTEDDRYASTEMTESGRLEFTFQTGFRGYSPKFSADGKVRAFAHLALGFGVSGRKWQYYSDEYYTWTPHGAFDLTIGIQIKEKYSIGYGFGSLFGGDNNASDNGNDKDHMIRFGISF